MGLLASRDYMHVRRRALGKVLKADEGVLVRRKEAMFARFSLLADHCNSVAA